jgi:hypothetical protein
LEESWEKLESLNRGDFKSGLGTEANRARFMTRHHKLCAEAGNHRPVIGAKRKPRDAKFNPALITTLLSNLTQSGVRNDSPAKQ